MVFSNAYLREVIFTSLQCNRLTPRETAQHHSGTSVNMQKYIPLNTERTFPPRFVSYEMRTAIASVLVKDKRWF